MKIQCFAIGMFAIAASAFSAQAHEIDPGGRIQVPCSPTDAVRMATITSALGNSHYWAPQTARRQMLALAQRACESGARVVTFVPPADQRYMRGNAQFADTAH